MWQYYHGVSTPAPPVGPVVYSPTGRRRLAVNQAPGGSAYPFVEPSYDIENLLGDLYLAYTDDSQAFLPPFRVLWLYGFGTIYADPPDGYTPTHDYDIVIVDASDQVVFDSTLATNYNAADWNADLRIIEFLDIGRVCRLTMFTSWPPDLEPRDYLSNIVPENGLLDSRTLELMPRSVRSIALYGDAPISRGNLKFQNGYNTTLVVTPPPAHDGGRRVTTLTAGAAPGSGLGRYPGCEDISRLATINGIAGDNRGNFIFAALDCLRVEQPNSVVGELATLVPATIKFSDDCTACNDCQGYRDVYEALRTQWARMVSIGQAAEQARDQYLDNRKRWILSGRDRQAVPLRLAMQPSAGCRLSVSGAYCNNRPTALSNLVLRFSFVYTDPASFGITADTPFVGVPVCGTAIRSGNLRSSSEELAGRTSPNQPELYAMLGEWPVYEAQFDLVAAGGMAFTNFMLEFANCDQSQQAQAVLEAFDGNTGQRLTFFEDWPQNQVSAAIRPIKAVAGFMTFDPCSV